MISYIEFEKPNQISSVSAGGHAPLEPLPRELVAVPVARCLTCKGLGCFHPFKRGEWYNVPQGLPIMTVPSCGCHLRKPYLNPVTVALNRLAQYVEHEAADCRCGNHAPETIIKLIDSLRPPPVTGHAGGTTPAPDNQDVKP